MREILSAKLWLGTAADSHNLGVVMQNGILAVVDLAIEEQPPRIPRSIAYCRFPIMDGQQGVKGILRAAITTVVTLLENQLPTLVCCSAGMSRSPAVVAAALAITQGGSPDARLREVVTGHPHDISPRLWKDICDLCSEIAHKG
jgi:protein-tyrosine phosphatase